VEGTEHRTWHITEARCTCYTLIYFLPTPDYLSKTTYPSVNKLNGLWTLPRPLVKALKNKTPSRVSVAHTCHSSYVGG
jgi:hypothetical protein